MVKLYQSETGKIHLVQGGRLYCNAAFGQIKSNIGGDRADITCLNCKWRMNNEDV